MYETQELRRNPPRSGQGRFRRERRLEILLPTKLLAPDDLLVRGLIHSSLHFQVVILVRFIQVWVFRAVFVIILNFMVVVAIVII